LPNGEECVAKTFFKAEEFKQQLTEYETLYSLAMQTHNGRLTFADPLRLSVIFNNETFSSTSTSSNDVISDTRDYIEFKTLKALTFMRKEVNTKILSARGRPVGGARFCVTAN
jgi:hypothetical protein